jgi:hypothetical protein
MTRLAVEFFRVDRAIFVGIRRPKSPSDNRQVFFLRKGTVVVRVGRFEGAMAQTTPQLLLRERSIMIGIELVELGRRRSFRFIEA